MNSQPRVPLLDLSVRTSKAGGTFYSGFFGKAKVIGFPAKEPDKYGNPVIRLFVEEYRPKPQSDQPRHDARFQRGDAENIGLVDGQPF